MGFQFTQTGTREGISKAIRDLKTESPDDCQTQLKSFQAFAISEISSLPSEFNGCRVDAHASDKGARTVQFNLIPLSLCV